MHLTNPQKLIYDMEKFTGGAISIVCGSMLISTDKSVDDMKTAVNELYRLNDALRIRVSEENGQPYQYITEYKEQDIEVLFFDNKEELDSYASEYAKEPLDFYGSLCDVKIVVLPDKKGVLAKLHHFISDAWTLSLIGTQFNKILNGEDVQTYSYVNYIATEEKYIESKRYAKDKDYFISQFKKCDEVTYLSEKQAHTFEAKRETFVVDKEDAAKILAYADKKETSVFSLFMSAVATYINRTKMNAEKFYIGTAVLNRNGVEEQNTMGMFINTAPVLIELDNEKSFGENSENIELSTLSVLRHQRYNYGTLLEELRNNHKFNEKLYDIMLSYQNAKVLGDEVETTWYHSGMQTESLQIHIDDRDSEGIFRVHYDYLVEKFNEHEISKLHEHLCNLLYSAIEDESKKIYELDILSREEKNTLLFDFNDTAVDYPRDKCVHQLFEEQVEENPDKIAVVACDKTLTYKELNEEANIIAHSLIEKGIGRGDIVAFMLPRRSYLIATMLGILKSGATYMPIDPDYPQDRTQYMLADSGAKFCVTGENISELLDNSKINNPDILVEGTDTCYCIYTSGSTGKPKGTLLTHGNVSNYVDNNYCNVICKIIKESYKNIISVTTVGFDIFVTESLLPLANGMEIVLASEEQAKLQSKLNDLIKANPADVLQTTPTKIKSLIVDKEQLDYLKTVKVIILGGEALESTLVEELKSLTDAEIFNIYGPTEATVWVTNAEIKDIDITIGKPIANTQIYIVDKYMKPVPIGVTGELCIAGDCVGAGYLNRPELTVEKFIDNPFGKGKMYKTGDLAYWRIDGNIAYVGRNDFQVKIRGLRIELGEIENAISSVDGINMSVVVVRKNIEGRQLICAFYTGEEKLAQEIKTVIGEKLPKYMLPHIFTYLDEMPLTSSGKISRKTLPEIDLENIETTVEYVAPETEVEQALVDSIKDILGCEKVSTLDNFFDIGGDSLKAIELTSQLESRGYDVKVRTIFDCETIQVLAKELTAKAVEEIKVEYGNVIPATPAQMRVYTAQSMNADSTLYNIPYVFKVDELDVERLQNAVNKLIERHEAIRTHFKNQNGQIMQVINESASVTVETLSSEDVLEFIRPFDLEKSPLIRVGYYENTVMIDIHHIISDGGTMPVFFKELNELYMGRYISTNVVQYGEFAVQEVNLEANEKYWLSVFDDEIPVLELPTDFARTDKQSFNGSSVYDVIDIELHNKITAKCKDLNITPYVFYMSCFNILLSKFSGNEDIVVGMPVSGRNAKYLNTIGMFVNTIALRNKPEGNKTIVDLFNEVKANSVLAIDNQNYPFGELVKKLNVETSGRNPLFDVMFAYQSEEMTDVIFGDKKAELLPVPITSAKCDFTFNIMPRNDDVVVMVEYCTDLYKEQKIQKFINAFKLILEQCLDEKSLIQDIEAMSIKEKNTLLFEFNDTAVDYPRDKCVHELFEEQVEKNPDKVAVIACDKTLTYAELNEQANRIAHSLIEKDIGRGGIVAFMLPRRSYLIATMLGILKSGAAYMPVDPDYPQDRIEYMLSDSGAKFCVTDKNISELLDNSNVNNPDAIVDGTDNCYCIYTSGSTGKPKGTLLTHGNVVNYVNNNSNNVVHKIIKESYKNIVSVTTVGFDIFVTESLLPLANGMEIVLASEEQAKLQSKLNDLIKANPADVLQTTPTKIKSLIVDKEQLDYLKAVKVIILGGEALEETLVEELKTLTDAEIFNVYGPTEATVLVSNTHINDAYNKKSATNVKNLFETAVNKYAHDTALVATDKILTYQELNKESNKIAHSLIERKIDVGDIVAFALPRKSYHITVMLGIIKSGAAYLPIDPDYPQDRIEYMLKDSGAKFYITENNVYDLLSNSDDTNPDIDIKNTDNCYCIYTSGSTGVPKGVVVNHNNVVNFCMDCRQNHFQHLLITKCKSILSINNTIFDITLQETILPLVNGVKVLFADNYGMNDIQQVLPLMQENNTGLILTPTKMKIYLSDASFCDTLKNVSVIMIGAEELSSDLVSKVKKHTDAVILNGYGPTETTCGVTYAPVDSIDIHIGRPIANTQIHIVDKYLKLVPIGVIGELCIAGDCVGAGYLNRPELTAEKFIDNPFGEGKMYKTGDLAYWREDGNIAYVGRNDFQVKIRGLRIELGEIENAISSVDGINMSVVVVRKNSEGRQLICAFYTGEEKSAQEIKNVIGERLPKYMLPHIFTHLDEMPLTSSGKTNRNALPKVDLDNISSDNEYVEPVTAIQKALCKILEELFKTEQVGINDDFFNDLGGDSLKVIEFVSEAHNEGIYFALQNVFDYPTIEKLCEFIENGDSQTLEFADYDYSKVNEVLKKNKVEYIAEPVKRDVGNILLAGATGYLGIHILADFLDNDDGIAYCLVRGKNQEDSKQRFNELLKFYFDDKYKANDRIVVICADLQKDLFGLLQDNYDELLNNVDTVINAAASVKHYGSYKYFYEANVETAKKLIDFTKQADAVLIHTSTLSVSGNSFADQFDGYVSEDEKHFFESSLYINQSLENVYVRSKFEAEIAVLEAIYDGLPAQIMRMGNLTNRFSDGKFQKNYESNAFLQRIRAVLNLGVVPDYLMELYSEFTPIDEAAEAVMTIARYFNKDHNVFHINSTKVVYLDKLLEYMNALGSSMKTVSEEQFSSVLRKTMEQTQSKHIFEAFIDDLDENDRLNYDSNIRIENEFTVEYLRKLGFEWNKIDFEYIRKYIEYFRTIGFLR